MWDGASHFSDLLVNFSAMFTGPSFDNFVTLVTGWIACVGRRQISRVIQFGAVHDAGRHHSVFYRFFSRARWNADELGKRIFGLVLGVVPDGSPIQLLVDDTLCHRSGPHIWGGGMHYDLMRSNFQGSRIIKSFSFGHNWVIVSVCVPTPWNPLRVAAIPVAFRLYRSKKLCPADQYCKRTEIARQMVDMVERWTPAGSKLVLVGDTEYASRVVVHELPDRVVFVGPMNMKAAVYQRPTRTRAKGRPPKKGARLLSPEQLIAARHIPWAKRSVTLYGRRVKVLMKHQRCLWYSVSGTRLVRMIVTRDPRGRVEDRAYFTTDERMRIDDIAHAFSLRWSQEEMHRNVKQHLGLEDPQNGWWRRTAGRRPSSKRPGPRPHRDRGSLSAKRTVPFVLTTYALVVLWYFSNGSFQEDVQRKRLQAPWYRQKREPSFCDMLSSLRRHIWTQSNLDHPLNQKGVEKKAIRPEDLLWAA